MSKIGGLKSWPVVMALVLGTAFWGGWTTPAAAAEAKPLKLAVIDMKKVFENYEKTRTMEARLKEQLAVFQTYSRQLTEQAQNLKKEFETLRDASQNLALTDAERESKRLAAQDKYSILRQKETELANYNRSKQAQSKTMYERLRAELLKEILQVVRNKAAAEGLDLVLDRSGESLNVVNLVVYNNESMDISDAVIRELNRGYQTDAAAPAGPAPEPAATAKP